MLVDGGADAREGLLAKYSEDVLVVEDVVDLESMPGGSRGGHAGETRRAVRPVDEDRC